MAFKYRGRSAEEVERVANESSSAYDKYILERFPALKVEKGAHTYRVLPPTFDIKKYTNHWAFKVCFHRNVGAKNQTYLCLNKMLGKPCPVCDLEAKMKDDGDKDANEIRQQYGYVAWVIDRDAESEGPQVWTVPFTLNRDFAALSMDPKTKEAVLIDDPDHGYDISFRRDGTGLNTRYFAPQIDRRDSPISEKQKRQDDWLDYIDQHPLDTVLQYFDYDYIDDIANVRSPREKDTDNRRGRDDDDRSSRSTRRGRDEEPEDDRRATKSSRDEDPKDTERDAAPSRSRRADSEDEPRGTREKPRYQDPEETADEPRNARRGRDDDSRDKDPEPDRDPPRRGRGEDPDDDRRSRRSAKDDDNGDDDRSSRSARSALKEANGDDRNGRGRDRDNGDSDSDSRSSRASRQREAKDDDNGGSRRGSSRRSARD